MADDIDSSIDALCEYLGEDAREGLEQFRDNVLAAAQAQAAPEASPAPTKLRMPPPQKPTLERLQDDTLKRRIGHWSSLEEHDDAARAVSDFQDDVANAIFNRDAEAMKRLTGKDWEPPPLERERENCIIGDPDAIAEHKADYEAAEEEALDRVLADRDED